MAYDQELAHRVREQLAAEEGVTEKAMFGGLAFLLHGNMAVTVSSHAEG
jgi:TfoX/Sxy family transcriptional regulator of competence genes